jgi:hypothetical protein
MDTYVAPPAREVDPPAVQTDSPAGPRDLAPVSEQLPPHDDWRWISDPAELSSPMPPSSRDAGPSVALVRAATQLGLQHWR